MYKMNEILFLCCKISYHRIHCDDRVSPTAPKIATKDLCDCEQNLPALILLYPKPHFLYKYYLTYLSGRLPA